MGANRRREDWLENHGSNSDTIASQKQWVKLWKTRVPGNVKNFAWRLAKNSIPTGETLKNRHISEGVSVLCVAPQQTHGDMRSLTAACQNVSGPLWMITLLNT